MIAPSRSNRHPTSREPIVASSRTSAFAGQIARHRSFHRIELGWARKPFASATPCYAPRPSTRIMFVWAEAWRCSTSAW
jgi:hypothetical protein